MDKRRDLVFAVVLCLFGVALAVASQSVRLGRLRDPIGSRMLPLLTGLMITVLAAGLAVRRVRQLRAPGNMVDREGASRDEEGYPASAIRAMGVWALCLAWVVLVRPLGFLLATPLVFGAIFVLLRVRGRIRVVALTVAMTLALYVTFVVALGVEFPAGPLRSLLG